jgi:uncharacterized protein (TIGR00369 family)
MPRVPADELMAFLHRAFPIMSEGTFVIDALDDEHLELRMPPHESHLRPGGTVSGPSLMLLADTAAYLVILSQVGLVAACVTTNLNCHFLRRPAPDAVLADARILRLGSRMAVVDVAMRSRGELVAQATVSYAIPKETHVAI